MPQRGMMPFVAICALGLTQVRDHSPNVLPENRKTLGQWQLPRVADGSQSM